MDEFRIVEVSPNAANRQEWMGSKYKFWYGQPGEPRHLFKKGRLNSGEDWAEKIACEIAELLRIPHAQIELAVCDGDPGIITQDFTHHRSVLSHGNELMVEFVDSGYPAHGLNFGVKQHTVANVIRLLQHLAVDVPSEFSFDSEITNGADVFVGYIMLNALIGNTDCHHENWGVLFREIQATGLVGVELAPTFDHASALGRELSDAERLARLDGKDQNRTVERYLARSECRFYGGEEKGTQLVLQAQSQKSRIHNCPALPVQSKIKLFPNPVQPAREIVCREAARPRSLASEDSVNAGADHANCGP